MKQFHFAWVVAALLTLGCSRGNSGQKAAEGDFEEEPLPERYENDDLPKAADELFDDFVYYFASNEQLQRRRISFPLEVADGQQQRLLEQEQWTMEPLFMTDGAYTLILDDVDERQLASDTTISEVAVERLFLTCDSVRRFLFSREQGRWMLRRISVERLAGNANARFLAFYQQFATDSVFQQRSLSRRIAFSGPDPDDDFAQMEGFITPDFWKGFAPELPHDSIYSIVYKQPRSDVREKTLLVCGISNGEEMELTFKQQRGQWKLTRLTE